MRLVAGLCPDPLGGSCMYTTPLGPLAVMREREGEESVGNREVEEMKGYGREG